MTASLTAAGNDDNLRFASSLSAQTISNREARGKEYVKLFNDDKIAFLRRIWEDDLPAYTSALHFLSFKGFAHVTLGVILESEKELLRQLMDGNLALYKKKNSAVKMELEKELDPSFMDKIVPSIYVNLLVDENKESPTPRELLRMCDYAEAYTSLDATVVQKIDNCRGPHPHPESGTHRYIETQVNISSAFDSNSGNTWHDSGLHVDIINIFIENLRERLGFAGSADMDQPLRSPLIHIGYATKPFDRLSQHRGNNCDDTNHIMHLFWAIALAYYPHRGFHLDQSVVYRVWDSLQAHPAQVIFSRLAQIYTGDGGGFSYHDCSESVVEMLKLPLSTWRTIAFGQGRITKVRTRLEAYLEELKSCNQGRTEQSREKFGAVYKEFRHQLSEDDAHIARSHNMIPLRVQAMRLHIWVRHYILKTVDTWSEMEKELPVVQEELKEAVSTVVRPTRESSNSRGAAIGAAPSLKPPTASVSFRVYEAFQAKRRSRATIKSPSTTSAS